VSLHSLSLSLQHSSTNFISHCHFIVSLSSTVAPTLSHNITSFSLSLSSTVAPTLSHNVTSFSLSLSSTVAPTVTFPIAIFHANNYVLCYLYSNSTVSLNILSIHTEGTTEHCEMPADIAVHCMHLAVAHRSVSVTPIYTACGRSSVCSCALRLSVQTGKVLAAPPSRHAH
jgi:hypothetical protein